MVAQKLAKTPPRMEEPRLDGAWRNVQYFAYFRHAELLNIVQDKGIAVVFRQLGQRLAQTQGFPLRAARWVGALLRGLQRRAPLPFPALLPKPVSITKVGDAMQPRR